MEFKIRSAELAKLYPVDGEPDWKKVCEVCRGIVQDLESRLNDAGERVAGLERERNKLQAKIAGRDIGAAGYSEDFVRAALPNDVAYELNRLLKERDEAEKNNRVLREQAGGKTARDDAAEFYKKQAEQLRDEIEELKKLCKYANDRAAEAERISRERAGRIVKSENERDEARRLLAEMTTAVESYKKQAEQLRSERDEALNGGGTRASKAYVRGVCDAISAEHGNNMSLIGAALEDVLAPVIDLSCR